MPEPYESVYRPQLVPKGKAYRINFGAYDPGAPAVVAFHDEADHRLWRDHPEKWAAARLDPRDGGGADDRVVTDAELAKESR